jgi:hypothetical protein
MSKVRKLIKFGTMFALVSSFASVLASEGVIEINQTKINAAGGGTYTITQPGSYRLTSNLTQVSAAMTNVITIDADNVSIDLNGFSIIGANNCSSTGVCSSRAAGSGIYSLDHRNVSVANGVITRISGNCIHSAMSTGLSSMSVDRVRVSDCGNFGMIIQRGSVSNSSAATCNASGIYLNEGVVSNSIARDNFSSGFMVQKGRVVSSLAQANGSTGITAYQVQDSLATDNKSAGISASGLASGNLASYNGSAGISATSSTLVIQNTLACNLVTNSIPDCSGTANQKSGGVSLPANSNLCNGTAC